MLYQNHQHTQLSCTAMPSRKRSCNQNLRRCWCNENCGKILAKSTRRNHRARIRRAGRGHEIAYSESATDASDDPMDDEDSGSEEELKEYASGDEDGSEDEDHGSGEGRETSTTVDEECEDYRTSESSSPSTEPTDSDSESSGDDEDYDLGSDVDGLGFVEGDFEEDSGIARIMKEWTSLEEHLVQYRYRGLYRTSMLRMCCIDLIILIGNAMLTEEDRDNIRAFNLRMKTMMSREDYAEMRKTFDHKMNLDSLYVATRRIAELSGLKETLYDCCVNSCICYTGKYSNLNRCPYSDCKESRFDTQGQPRRRFSYLPLIPRFSAMYQSKDTAHLLSYRADFRHVPGTVQDVFSGSHYQEMLRRRVEVDGEKLRHNFFSDRRDIAVGVCTDGFLLFNRNRRGPSATPILVKNYNLPPTIRTHLEHLLCVGVIPGPRQPKDLASFLTPLDDEFAELAQGIRCFDSVSQSLFSLHGYQLDQEGDIIAIEKFLGIKGHSSLCPCRSCMMRGCRMAAGSNKVYYIPITQPSQPDLSDPLNVHQIRKAWDITNLERREHLSFARNMHEITNTTTKKHRRELEMYYGVKSMPALVRVSSLDFGSSCPWEWMSTLR